jgi:hypothetical protein
MHLGREIAAVRRADTGRAGRVGKVNGVPRDAASLDNRRYRAWLLR